MLPIFAASGAAGYYYGRFSTLIDERLQGERIRTIPRVYGRPLAFRGGLTLSSADVVQRLNDLGYTQHDIAREPGTFAVDSDAVTIVPRGAAGAGRVVRLEWAAPRRARAGRPPRRRRLPACWSATAKWRRWRSTRRCSAGWPIPRANGAAACRSPPFPRTCSRPCWPSRTAASTRTRASIPSAWSARSSPTSAAAAPTWSGASTITQQLARNFFLTEEMALEQQSGRRSIRRKLLEQFMAVVLETRATKEQILELYLNEVYLGHRGSFALHGVAVAARTFFAKDLSNLTVGEGALIAGVIQSPGNHSPFADAGRARDRRDVVLRRDGGGRFHHAGGARAGGEGAAAGRGRARLDFEAPYFVDYVAEQLDARAPGPGRAHRVARGATRRSTSTCSAPRRTRCAPG